MPTNKLSTKWYPLIWLGLIFASFIRNDYGIYLFFTNLNFANTQVVIGQITLNFIMSGILPAVLCYCCGSILYSMMFRRGIRFCSKNDFVYIAMIFTLFARVIMGLIEITSVIDQNIFVYTSSILDVVVLSTSLYLMYFLVILKKYKVNDKQAFESFSLLASVYLVVQGIHTVMPCIGVFMLKGSVNLTQQYQDLLEQYLGHTIVITNHQIIACIVATVLFAVLVVVSFILGEWLRKKAKNFVEPEKFDDNDDNNPFNDFLYGKEKQNTKDEKVFEEFDI